MTMKATATVINMKVIFRSVFRCRCCRFRVDAVIKDESIPVALLVDIIER